MVITGVDDVGKGMFSGQSMHIQIRKDLHCPKKEISMLLMKKNEKTIGMVQIMDV
jgi:hypothetical protein